MAITVAEIVELYTERQQAQGPLIAQMRELTMAYEGSVAVPLPELDRNEKVAVANLIAQGLDQTAMRIASTLPDVWFPPTRPGVDLQEKNARISRQAVLGWWDASEMDLKLGRRARWLIGYACSPVQLCWDDKRGCPKWKLRDPTQLFPARGEDPDCMVPDNAIYAFKRSLSWLRTHYPDETLKLQKGKDARPDHLFELLEYSDSDECVLVVVGRARDPYDRQGQWGTQPYMELERAPNRVGTPLTFVPGRLTLHGRHGAYDGLIGLYQQQAKLMALEVIAVTRGIFPDEWLVSRPNEMARVVQMANGRKGVLGQIEGGEIMPITVQPGYKTEGTIDRIERYMRVEGGIPAEYGGESTTNVRTGRRGDSILSATVDFPVQEAQRVLARSMQHENSAAINMAKAYSPNRARTFYIGRSSQRVDYVPSKNLVSDVNLVVYPASGSDINQLVVGLGQRLGLGEMSLYTAMRLDPMVDDPDHEKDLVIAEKLEAALLNGIAQQVQAGQLGAADVAQIVAAVREDRSTLEDAVLKVQKAKQAEQATSGPPGTPTGPVAPGAPEAQPGLTPPGQAPPAAGTIGPAPNQQGLAQLLGALKSGAQSPVPRTAA